MLLCKPVPSTLPPSRAQPMALLRPPVGVSLLTPPPCLCPSVPAANMSCQFYSVCLSLVPTFCLPAAAPVAGHHRHPVGTQHSPHHWSPLPPSPIPSPCNSQGHLLKTQIRWSHSLKKLQRPHHASKPGTAKPLPPLIPPSVGFLWSGSGHTACAGVPLCFLLCPRLCPWHVLGAG